MPKKILLITLLSIFSASGYARTKYNYSSMDYYLNWDGKSSLLKIRLEYTPNKKNSTEFIFGKPEFGGQSDIFSLLKHVVSDPGDKVKINENLRKITVYHKGRTKKTLLYEIDGNIPEKTINPVLNELFRPVIIKRFLYTVDNQFMLAPEEKRFRSFSMQWEKFPENTPYFNALKPESTPGQKILFSTADIGKLLLVAGKDLAITEYKIYNIPYYSIVSNNSMFDIKTELTPFYKVLFPAMRDYWKDYTGNYRYTIVLPTLTPSSQETFEGSGGFNWGNGFIMKYSRKFDDGEKRILAHEPSHYWIGTKIRIGNDSFVNQWFGEGFNDYIALVNLVKSKIYDKTSFLNYINEDVLKKHYLSNIKDVPEASIKANFWTNVEYQKLPYRRGLIYAFYLDNQIRLVSSGKYSLRDFVLDLYQRSGVIKSRNPEQTLSLKDFVTVGSKYLPKAQLESEIETYLIQGKPLDFNTIKLIQEFKMEVNNNIPSLTLTESTDLLKIYQW